MRPGQGCTPPVNYTGAQVMTSEATEGCSNREGAKTPNQEVVTTMSRDRYYDLPSFPGPRTLRHDYLVTGYIVTPVH